MGNSCKLHKNINVSNNQFPSWLKNGSNFFFSKISYSSMHLSCWFLIVVLSLLNFLLMLPPMGWSASSLDNISILNLLLFCKSHVIFLLIFFSVMYLGWKVINLCLLANGFSISLHCSIGVLLFHASMQTPDFPPTFLLRISTVSFVQKPVIDSLTSVSIFFFSLSSYLLLASVLVLSKVNFLMESFCLFRLILKSFSNIFSSLISSDSPCIYRQSYYFFWFCFCSGVSEELAGCLCKVTNSHCLPFFVLC